jgi:hypothetical protein
LHHNAPPCFSEASLKTPGFAFLEGKSYFFRSANANHQDGQRLSHVIRYSLIMREMNIRLSLDDDLVKEVRKIAVENDTTLTGLVRDYLQKLADENTSRAGNDANARRSTKLSHGSSSTFEK